MTEKPSKRLSRHRRAQEGERPPMVLTERDREIVKAVNDHRALLAEQIEALFFASRSTAQYRLSRLYQHEYLERHFPSILGSAPGSTQAIYTVGKRGAQLLVNVYGYDRSDLRIPKRGALAWKFIEHLFQVNAVRIAIALAARTNGWVLEEWQDETVFRAHPDYVMTTDRKGREHKKPVLPDGYFSLQTPRGKSRFFLEVDRGVEPKAKFRPQIVVYEAYTHSQLYQERFQAKSLRVLIITTSEKRLANLKTITEQAGGDRKYWFTTFDQVRSETVLTAPIWQQLASHSRLPLIEVT